MEKEIQHLLDQDIIEKVNEPTGWVSPPVVTPKKDQSQIRLNVDMRVANQAIPRRHTQHPTIDDVITELSGSTVFSHLDMSKGYHQLELKESSRNVTTFSTHIGLYRYKRLNYGTRSAAEIFQETIREELTQDLKGVFNISDDIIVHGRDTKEHDANLEALLKKSREKNITFNKTKCEFNKERVVYYGLMFSKEGVSPDPCKVQAIKEAGRPRNAAELNSFLCTVRYSARFMEPNKYQKAVCKLGELLRGKFEWMQVHTEAFEELKNMLSSDTVQAYFDPQAEHELHVDGCPMGLAATLTQRRPGEQVWQVVQYASRSLTDTEKRYSQIELEALAGDFGCKKFHLFLYGIPFKMVTDHKPLESVFNKPTHTTSIRVQRIVNRMLDYDFAVEYRPGRENMSDYTSRHPVSLQTCTKFELRTTKEVKRYVNYVVTCNTPNAVTKEQVQKATDEDPTLLALRGCIHQGWIDPKAENLQVYKQVFSELAVVDGMVVRGDRIVVPETLKQRMIEIAHEGHQGQVQTKQLLRAHVWFPGMDYQCDKFVSTCIYCQSNTPDVHREPLKMTELPEGPWRKVSVDFCGPLANGDFALVFHCQYSRYPVVEFVGSTSEKATIPVFRRVFDTYGVPEVVKSDNGPPFNSHKFEEYAREEGFKHQKVTPGWPEANGDVERCMQRIKKTARIAALQGRPIRDEVRRGTRAYRATVHPTTGASPNKLMFGRELRGKLPEARRQAEHPDDATVRKRDREQKEKMKKYADKRRHTAAMRIKVGDTVLCKQEKKNSLTPLFDPVPMVVIGIKGDMITAKNNQRIRTRNYADWKLLKDGCRHSATCDESDDEDAFDPDEVVVDEHQQGAEQPKDTDDMEQRWAIRDRPRRKITSTKDSKYKDFICD